MIAATGDYSTTTSHESSSVTSDESSSVTSDESSSVNPADEDIKFTLEQHLKDIILKYKLYVDSLCAIIEEKKVSLEALQRCLLSLPAFNRRSRNWQRLTIVCRRKLEKANTVAGIFKLLTSEYASFLNYDIFENIMKKYNIHKSKEELKYSEHLKEFIDKHAISEFAKISPDLLKHKTGSKLTLKFDIDYTCKLAEVIELKNSIAEIMGLYPSELEIVDIKMGCIIVTFLIPAHVPDAIFTFTSKQEHKFQAASAQWLECNGHTFHFGESKTLKSIVDPGTTKIDQMDPNPDDEMKMDQDPDVEMKMDPDPDVEMKMDQDPDVEMKMDPDPDVEMKMDPVLDPEIKMDPDPDVEMKMDPKTMDDEFKLEKNLKEIITKYATYVDCLHDSIEEKGVSPEDLRSYLLSLPASSKSFKGKKLTLLSDMKDELDKADTINDIFIFLTTECASFMNYDVFQNLMKKYNISEDREELKYPEHLRDYVNKHKISETKLLPKYTHNSKRVKLILKYNIEYTCRLAKVFDLREAIAEIMNMKPTALHIVDVKKGCIVVTFLIPASVANTIFTPDTAFNPQQEDELRAASVLWLQCNGYTFHFQSQKDEVYSEPPGN